MSTLNTAQRKALPASDFGDPTARLYPIVDQDDVDSAAHLIGKASNPDAVKKRIIAIAKRKGLSIPDAWKSDAGMSAPTALGSDKPPDGMVYRSGLIFKAGDYPDQRMNVTAEDLEAAVAAFKGPLDAELEHFNTEGHKTFLDGHLGQLVEVWAKGGDLFGRLLVPEWMDPMWEAFGRKVSIVLNRATKQLTRIGLVLDPQVEEAAVMSAYSAFAGNRHSAADRKDIQQIHELAGNLGAECAPTSSNMSAKTGGRKFMQLDSIAFWKKGGRRFREEARQEGITTVPDEEVYTLLDEAERTEIDRVAKEQEALYATKLADADAKLKAADEALFKATADRLTGEAKGFVDALILSHKVLPAERDTMIEVLTRAGLDDATSGPVTFSNGTQGSRLEQQQALFSARQPHNLTQEQAAGNAPFTVVQGGQPAPKTGPDTYDDEKLLSMTAAGKKALSRRSKQA